ncbi:glycoside hydrolase family 15 protein [Metallosphaera tengchongensis]|uniref:Glycoside hydrolase family 15 protein n=1 Tax=Metallosphaera tengchongensis TaxID=1532350 RepID=A0A6N0NSG9_9CREN|nr:glycoside hydrolase family 15 protein [Metallosphaera tengchongensis]QKQ99036.1 glycoside hydrolase family 15 protein [Metallosphaera tengchongensis]
MTRSIILGNGKLTALLDGKYMMRELYFPLSVDNHLHAGRIGLFSSGFNWLHDMNPVVKYKDDTLVSIASANNIVVEDAVDMAYPILVRRVKANGRVFFTWDFHINGTEYGDTALYDPSTLGMVHYKRDKWFLFSCGVTPFQYATGYKETGSLIGTWKDCEDGELSGNPIAQGAVDSAVSYQVSGSITCWLVAGRSYKDVVSLNRYVLERGAETILDRTDKYWRAWSQSTGESRRDALVIAAHWQENGALPASLDTDIMRFNRDSYNYVWHRDASMASIAFTLLGFEEEGRRLFQFSRPLLYNGFLFQKYTVDGHWGSTWHPWTEKYLPIQEDETALMIYALWVHFKTFRNVDFIKDLYRPGIKAAADFLCSYIDDEGEILPSYDLWEERFGVHFFTAAAVYAGLISASKFSSFFGEDNLAVKYTSVAEQIRKNMDEMWVSDHFARSRTEGKVDPTVDSSTVLGSLLAYPLGDPRIKVNRGTVERKLKVNGGICRYEGDMYMREGKDPNPWFITTLWVAQELIAEGDKDRAMGYVDWVRKNSLWTGLIPEQITSSGRYSSVCPLVWSHAEMVKTLYYLRNGFSNFLS